MPPTFNTAKRFGFEIFGMLIELSVMELLELTSSELKLFDFARHFGMETVGSQAIENVLNDLRPLLGSALVIGGLAVIHHGYRRYTEDADILYADHDGPDLLRRLSPKFKLIQKGGSGWHKLEHKATKTRLEMIPEGGLTTYGFIPGPHRFESDNGFLPLWGLIWLKMVSGRTKDDADIVELARVRFDDVLATRVKLASELAPESLERFDALISRVKREMENDPFINQKILP